ncbi:murein DD-endopeptidase MepM [Oxobacter pfennigii]|uniref:Murein DD-endopeptidase MepM n=1 Tax=Oxobacter pfennigii TaxID=36849 RepID=A0A0N8NT23_9CLOT|nr:M23 family metallopeptidase [Oxobacter pfennigii]KPU43632.1 murein DD-endopeptidase MepM [Oxobacter pfennigii]
MNLFFHRIMSRVGQFFSYIWESIKNTFKRWFNRKEFFTIMVVPHTPIKNVKSLKFSRRLVSSFVILNFIMFSIVCVFAFSYHMLSARLESKKAEYDSLQAMKDYSEKQLSEYKASEDEMKEKIKVIQDLETRLRDIIEAKGEDTQSNADDKDDSEELTSFKIASRGMGGGGILYPGEEEVLVDNLQGIDQISDTIDEMATRVDDEIKELDRVIAEAEKKLKEMRAKPSVLPVSGKITSTFGYRKNPFGKNYEFHDGIDIANSRGTAIRASADGVVTIAGRDGSYGILVKINHGNGYESLYGHNSKLNVKVGQRVERGDIIAYMGSTGRSTGNHCHFEVRYKGKAIDPYTVK